MSTIFLAIGFTAACYAVMANDSLQTLGTWIESNTRIRWVWLWAIASTVLVMTLTAGWYLNGGDVSWGRLTHIPAIDSFHAGHALAPVALLFLTRWGLPVSTTFLVLSVFASNVVMGRMIVASVLGYSVALLTAYGLWVLLRRVLDEGIYPSRAKAWGIAQAIATMTLWSQWLSHDVANIAVYLPRDLSALQLAGFLSLLVGSLGIVLARRGGAIQRIVSSKTGTQYVRNATIIDLAFAVILFGARQVAVVPMSTTWVFVGLLAGRELALRDGRGFPLNDLARVSIGLALSVLTAALI